MRSIGIGELRRSAGRYVRLAAAGETVQIIDRGRAVALLVPSTSETRADRMVGGVRIRPGRGHITDIGPPLPARSGQPPLSEVLAELRRAER